jgi:hypothetical protein
MQHTTKATGDAENKRTTKEKGQAQSPEQIRESSVDTPLSLHENFPHDILGFLHIRLIVVRAVLKIVPFS